MVRFITSDGTLVLWGLSFNKLICGLEMLLFTEIHLIVSEFRHRNLLLFLNSRKEHVIIRKSILK